MTGFGNVRGKVWRIGRAVRASTPKTIGQMRRNDSVYTQPWAYDEKTNTIDEDWEILSGTKGGTSTLLVHCIHDGLYDLEFTERERPYRETVRNVHGRRQCCCCHQEEHDYTAEMYTKIALVEAKMKAENQQLIDVLRALLDRKSINTGLPHWVRKRTCEWCRYCGQFSNDHAEGCPVLAAQQAVVETAP